MPRRSKNAQFNRTESKRIFTRKRCFIVLIIILLCGILAVGLGLTIPAIIAKENRKKMEQYEQKIINSLSRYFENMDQTIDPCEDFYHYACGNYIKKWSVETTKENVNSDIHKEIVKNTEAMLQTEVKTTGNDYRNKVKKFYESCINEDLLNSLDKTPLTRLLDELGGWPIIKGNHWQSIASDWMDLTFQMHKKRLVSDYLMELSVVPDIFDESSYTLLVSQPSRLSLPFIAYNNDAILSAYRQYMTNVANFLEASQATLDQDIEDIILFEQKLVNITQDQITSKDYSKMSINSLKMEIGEIDWYEYFNQLLPYHVQSSQQILIRGMNYLRNFSKLIKNIDIRIITNYLLWRIVSPSGMRYLYKDAADIQEEFYRKIGGGNAQETTRSAMCTDDTIYFMYLAVNAMYVRKYIPPSLKPSVVKVVNFIHDEFVNVINTLKWMDAKSKETALKKMSSMKSYIAFPDEIYDDNAINGYYEDLIIENDKLLKNVLTIKWFEKLQNFRLLKSQEKLEWTKHGPVLSASASYTIKNELTITLPFLMGVHYDQTGLMVTNFGALGSVIGHELFHCIDRQGSLYDEKGILHMWWTNYTKSSFELRENCYVQKYNNFVVNGLNISIDGTKTVAENFADNIGLHIALQAYLKWVNDNGNEIIPKSIQETSRQLFWISYANKFCSVQNLKMTYIQMHLDNHCLDEYRIIGAVSNMPQFGEDFGCRNDSKMNSYMKCPLT